MSPLGSSLTDLEISAVLAGGRNRFFRRTVALTMLLAVVAAAFVYAGAFDPLRYRGALSTLVTLVGDAIPPDFRRWPAWGGPLLETLATSIAGTTLAAAMALPLALVAAQGGRRWLACRVLARLALNTARSIPDLVWGVIFVAAVGFGPLPGVLALAAHSTGMLGKFYAEILQHVDPAPGLALQSQGVSRLGVLRFAVLPQVLPRLADVTIYRWEHNVRAATVLGIIGAGGLGLEIVTAFHLFEYQEAAALILVMLALVTVISSLSDRLRNRFLAGE